jgi:hypothetical protein
MKLGLLVLSLSIATTLLGGQIVCPTTGTYQDLLNTNAAGGCIISNKVFSNFGFSGAATGGAHTVVPIELGYATVNAFPDTGFQFNMSVFAATSGQTNDIALSYLVSMASGFPPLIASGDLVLGGITTFTGSATIRETLNIGCNSSTCPDVAGVSFSRSISAFLENPPGSSKPSDTYHWSPATLGNKPGVAVSQVFITEDMNVVGGSSGSATISRVPNTVDQVGVPEPMTMVLLGSGLLLMGIWRPFGISSY